MPRLLITNCTTDTPDGGVYVLDTDSEVIERVHDQPTRGITPGPDGAYYAVGNRGAVYRIDPDRRRAELVADLQLTGSHDLRWLDGEFLLVVSYGNQVVRLDREFRILDRIRLVEDEGDVCHPNCLLRADGQDYLCIFTLTPGRREEKRETAAWRADGKVLRLDWDRHGFAVVHQPLAQPHSLLHHRELFYCCESATSEICRLSPDFQRKETLCRLHGFVRGLVFAPGQVFAGISQVRVKVSLAEKVERLFRMPCGLVELDPETWKSRRQIPIPGTEVYEILALDS